MVFVFKILFLFILFFAPLHLAIRDVLDIPVSPHVAITLLAAAVSVTVTTKIFIPHSSITAYLLFLWYVLCITIVVSYIPGHAGAGIHFAFGGLALAIPAILASLKVPGIHEPIFAATCLIAFVLGVFISVIFAFRIYVGGDVLWGGRLVSAPDQNPAFFGVYIASAIIFLLSFARRLPLPKFAVVAASTVLAIALLMTQSRNAMLGLVLGGVITLLVNRSFKKNVRTITYSLAAVALISVSVTLALRYNIISDLYYQRVLLTLTMDDPNVATAGRASIFLNYMEWGISAFGFGADRDAYSALSHGRWLGSSPHNSFVFALVSGGIVGLSLLVYFYWNILKSAASVRSDIRFGMIWISWFWVITAGGNDLFVSAVFWIPFTIWVVFYMSDKNEKQSRAVSRPESTPHTAHSL